MGYGITDPDYQFSDKGGTIERFTHKHLHRDLSTIMISPTRGCVPTRVVDSWMSMLKAPNQRWASIATLNMEVGAAYEAMINLILASPDLSKFRYILTVEEDNLPGPMAFVDLLEAAEEGQWDVLGALYYVKGPCGFPQVWGDVNDEQENYRPQVPKVDGVGDENIVACQGTGMGFTLYRLDVFRKLQAPWFQTTCAADNLWTQDLFLPHRAREQGVKLKIGVHCGIRVGHLDVIENVVW